MIGQTISHYKILEKLGEGGMGIVYKAHDTRLDRIVALKFLLGNRSGSAEERERFLEEARAASSLSHPNIATIYAVEEHQGETFIAMEFIDGRPLDVLIKGGLPFETVKAIAAAIAEGLKAAHQKGIVHRDIKSGNIMVSDDGRVRIMDFGLAKRMHSAAVTNVGITAGTIAYMSPEQVRGEPVDHRADIWSFGVVVYEVLTGRRPFAADHDQAILYQIMNEPPPPMTAVRPNIPQELATVVEKALQKDLTKRFQSMSQVIETLDRSRNPGVEYTALPGTATFLFCDIEGSTKILQSVGGKTYAEIIGVVREVIRLSLRNHGGREVDTAGDGLFALFPRANDAIVAAVEVQRTLADTVWPGAPVVRVRMGLHTGEPRATREGFVGIDVHRAARICAAGYGGQVLLSATTQSLLAHDLPSGVSLLDLGDYRLKDLPHPEKLFQVVTDGLQLQFPALQAPRGRLSNLPLHLTPLIGREREIEEACQLLAGKDVRLLSLTGPGGTGKTSLAMHVASRLTDDFPDGVYFVSLEPISDASLLSSAVCQTLGVDVGSAQSVDGTLKHYLEAKKLLLILDNFEQLVQASSIVNDLLTACPNLKILVTSRVVLRLRLEREYPVFPLALPGRGGTLSVESLGQFAAVELFAQRARAARPEFAITNENAGAVAEICRRLDGLPLAIELAAARLKLFTPQTLLARLGGRLDLLKTSTANVHARHQTLRNAIEWSYELLTDEEKAMFRLLGVFVGGFTIEAVEEVQKRSGIVAIDVIDLLEALIDKSLVRREDRESDEPRFTMLETIHEYALERLNAGNDAASVWRAHAEYYLGVAEAAEPHLTGPEQRHWLDILLADHDNFRAVFQWVEQENEGEIGLRLGGALWRFWIVRGFMTHGERRLGKVVALSSAGGRTAFRAKALNGLGTLRHELSQHVTARPVLEESLEIWRDLGDKGGMATTLNNLGWVSAFLGHYGEGMAFSKEALALHRDLGNRRGIALSLNNLGWIALTECDFRKAIELFEESLEIRKALGDQRGVAFVQINIAWVAYKCGEAGRALEMLRQSREALRALGDRQVLSWAMCVLGNVMDDIGKFAEAVAPLEESLSIMKEIGNLWSVGYESCSMGKVLHHLGDLKRAGPALEDAYRQSKDTETPFLIGYCASELGSFHQSAGNPVEARRYYLEALQNNSLCSERMGIASCLLGMARIAAERGAVESAAKLCSSLDRIVADCGGHLPAWERARYDELLVLLGPASKEQPLGMEEAVAFARVAS